MAGASQIIVSVPGRICLFGEHQDFLGLSVIAMAIDLRMRFVARSRDDGKIIIEMPDIESGLVISPYDEIRYEKKRDYLRSVVNVLKRRGVGFGNGYLVTITSDIPINAGVSSSSAMVIGWARLLLELDKSPLRDDPVEIARIGHEAEVLEFNEPGGMMDHYACSLGGLVYIDCGDPISVETLDTEISGFVLCNSREKKNTTGILRDSKEGYRHGEQLLRESLPSFSLRSTPMADVELHLEELPRRERMMVCANLRNRDICREARTTLVENDLSRIGQLLDEHHAMLRDHLGISTPRIEEMIAVARSAGAKGCKVNGSGGGGTMIAYAPGREQEVAKAVKNIGAGAHVVKKAPGVEVEK